MNKDRKPTIITNPPKMWWAGDERVEKYMPPIYEVIKKHVGHPSKAFTEIYNKAYEAIYRAIKESEDE